LVWTQRLKENTFASAGDQPPVAKSSSLYSDTTLTELSQLPKLKESYTRIKTEPHEIACDYCDWIEVTGKGITRGFVNIV
jgi:hypothetical protein